MGEGVHIVVWIIVDIIPDGFGVTAVALIAGTPALIPSSTLPLAIIATLTGGGTPFVLYRANGVFVDSSGQKLIHLTVL